jgi:hypothetical protein
MKIRKNQNEIISNIDERMLFSSFFIKPNSTILRQYLSIEHIDMII